ncbi:FG-GAP-like repeat-containing protein [Cellvibrio sp. ARAG 10.3]|uniref:FG-GAP-like repeat-containing protein n=1 Tax=Cellvibrio sp. ARAG 10.3 TaxID=3451358 RepID=UPI003F4823A1
MFRSLLLLIAFLSLGFIQSSQAAEIGTHNYDIYVGDINSDGDDDFYFHGKPLTLILHGDIATPILLHAPTSFVIYGDYDTYASPAEYSLTSIEIAARVAAGTLKLYKNNHDFYIWSNGNAGLNNVLLRGSDSYAPALLLSSSTNNTFPLLSQVYNTSGNSNLSDRSLPITFQDINYDGRKDVIVGSYSSDRGEYAFVADSGGIPAVQYRELSPSIDSPLPSGATHVGITPGEFRVDESGAATYSVPIMLAEGTAGVTPQLSLNYSSLGANGIAGKGWSLGGLSSITRCRQTLIHDGTSKPITWTAQDRFCIDGQRLMLVSGTYGAANSTYKTELDNFALVTAKGGSTGHPAYFLVEAKDGSTSVYGNTTNAKVTGGAANTTLTWAINRFQDNVGNAIDFVYEGNGSNGQRIKTIHYAFPSVNSSATASARTDSKASIIFDYEARSDISPAYIAGHAFGLTQRLKQIRVNNEGAELRRYNLTYMSTQTSDARYKNKISRLQHIQECRQVDSATLACLPATTFNWGGGTHVALNQTMETIDFPDATDDKYVLNNLFADVTGNGKQDLIYLMYERSYATSSLPNKASLAVRIKYADSTASSMIPLGMVDNYNQIKINMLDYNADGRQDLAVYDSGWKIYVSTTRPDGTWKIDSSSTVISTLSFLDKNTFFADINGDGLVDAISNNGYRLLGRNEQLNSSATAYSFKNFTSFQWEAVTNFPEVATSQPSFTGLSDCRHDGYETKVLPETMGDFNGDGVADFIGTYTRKFSCIASGSSSRVIVPHDNYYVLAFDQGVLKNYSQERVLIQYTVMDLNGDGLSDLLYSSGQNRINYRLNNGNGFNAAVAWIDLPYYGSSSQRAVPQYLDFNGDGATDIAWHDRNTGKLSVRLWGDTESFNVRDVGVHAKTSHLLMDVSGDGVIDYIRITSAALTGYRGVMAVAGEPIPCHYVYHQGNASCVGGNPNPSDPVPSDEQHNAIISIQNGLGGITKIIYGTLSNSGHYSTTDVNATVTQHTYPTNCTGHPQCPATYTYTVTDASSFYSRLNGGWDLPDDSVTLISGNDTKGAPVLEVNGPAFIVAEVQSSAPTAENANALSKVEYFYAEAKMQASGRGFLGFNRLTTIDKQTGISTTTTYRQDFPFNGQPLSTTIHSATGSAGKMLSSAVNEWDYKEIVGPDNTKRYQPFVKKSTEKTYALKSGGSEQGDLLQTVVTETELYSDAYGNTKNIKVTTTDGSTTLVKNTYSEYGATDWEKRMGRLSRVEVTTNNDSNNKRISTFEYYGGGETGGFRGMLKKEMIEPGNALGTTTTYTYDGFGNKTGVSTVALGSSGQDETRTTTTTYKDNKGRYIQSTSNSLGHTSTINSINSFGSPTRITSVNGLTTNIFYDALGSEYMRKDATGAWTRTDTIYCGQGVSCPAGAVYRSWKRAAGGGGTIEYFDVLGRNIRTTTISFDGRHAHVDTEYDNLSRVKRQSNPYYNGGSISGWTENDYDILGRVVKVTGPDNSEIESVYENNVTTITNSLDQKRIETRNGLGQLVKVEDHLEGTISYSYDVYGGLLSATTTADGMSVTVRMCYDKLGRKVAMHDPDKGGFNIGTSYKGGTNATKTCDEVAASLNSTKLDGWWYYNYNGFGELISQIDAKGQTTTMTYDLLGRVKTRTDYKANNSVEGHTTWFYDTAEDGAVKTGAKGQPTAIVMNTNGTSSLCSAGALNCHRTVYNYDDFGRPTTTQVYHPGDATAYTTSVTYDKYSRPSHQYDVLHQLIKSNGTPQTSGVEIRYNLNGYEQEVIDLGSGQRLKKTLATNARGQVTSILRGNGATTTNTYDETTGNLTRQQASVISPVKLIQNIGYDWDTVGNLNYRHNQSAKMGGGNNNLQERFCYDNLNRLTRTYLGSLTGSCTVSGAQSIITYNGHGNITSKTGVGSYTYGSQAGPHAVTATTTGNKTYQYDRNGNMISDKNNGAVNRSFEYTTYDQVSLIANDNTETTFYHGPDRSRWKRVDTKNSLATTTRYFGSIERIETGLAGVVEWKRSIAGALFTYKTDTANNLLTNGISKAFIYKDHLGSVDIITDAVGTLTHSMSFDAWGARRSAETWNIAYDISKLELTGFNHEVTTRGYTGHEMVDELGIIHMNGRIYDAKLARFLQADPFIQAATNTQSYNRYSYVLNNPLNMTDPSGFFFKKLYKSFMKVSGIWHTHKLLNNYAPSVVPFIPTVLNFIPVVGPWISAAFSANNAFYLTGSFTAGAKAFAISRGSSYVFQQIGGADMTTGGRIFAHAMVGGVISELQGGKFAHGFVSAGLSKAFMSYMKFDYSDGSVSAVAGRTMVAALVGGTISEISGGKFANGAVTAAMAHLFNQESSASKMRDYWGRVAIVAKAEADRIAGLSLSEFQEEFGSFYGLNLKESSLPVRQQLISAQASLYAKLMGMNAEALSMAVNPMSRGFLENAAVILDDAGTVDNFYGGLSSVGGVIAGGLAQLLEFRSTFSSFSSGKFGYSVWYNCNNSIRCNVDDISFSEPIK